MTADVADMAAVRADDALLDVLGGRDTDQAAALADDRLNGLLLAWRREADAQPAADLVSSRRAVWMFRRARWTAHATRFFSRITRRTR